MNNSINRQYRDSLFKIVFNEKKELMSLYNAISGKNLTNPDELTINTLEDAIYVGLKNDISFIFDESISIYEHQSTFTPNLALRGFFYIADLYKSIYYSDKIYTKSRIFVLTPRLVVFYNGNEDIPDVTEQHLSDSFFDKSNRSDLEVTAHIYNINYGHNKELMAKCRKLYEYCTFVNMVKEVMNNTTINDLRSALDEIIDECISGNILADVLTAERNRVMTTILAQFDAEKYIEYEREYSYSEGLEMGRSEERANTIRRMLESGKSPSEIAEFCGYDINEIMSIQKSY